jgi:hypothetical protein
VREWICRASRQAILLTKGCIGSDDRPVHTVGIPNGGVFLPSAKGFLLNSIYGLPNRDPLWILCQGAVVLARSAQDSPECIQRKHNSQMQNAKEIITGQAQNAKVLHLLPIFTHP